MLMQKKNMSYPYIVLLLRTNTFSEAFIQLSDGCNHLLWIKSGADQGRFLWIFDRGFKFTKSHSLLAYIAKDCH